jgi:type II secretory pathway pseudopilin PulG
MKLRTQHHAAFTMIEIAIALGVIAVALVAIIGVLPAGMNVQKDNRQDTIINQDGAYLLEAIRTSAQNIPDLVSFADVVDGQPVVAGMTSSNVVQLMSEPNGAHMNVFRAITGPAVMRGQGGVPNFRYMVISDVKRLNNVNPDLPWAAQLQDHTYEVRLVFFWPLAPNSTNITDTTQKHVMRTIITGTWDVTNRLFNLSEYRP